MITLLFVECLLCWASTHCPWSQDYPSLGMTLHDRDRHVNKDKAARAVSWLWWRFAWSAWRLIISSRVCQATKREGSSRRGHVQGAGHREEHGTCRGLKGLWGPRIEQQAMCHFSVPAALGEVTLTHSMWPSWVVCPCARLAGHRTGTAHPGWALTVT